MRFMLRALALAAVSVLPRPALADFGISITSPVPGSVLVRSIVIVNGTLTDPPLGVGVTVNGQLALVDGTQWAMLLSIDNQLTQISATARDLSGQVRTAAIGVTANIPPNEPNALLRAVPFAGPPILVVGFSLRAELPVHRVRLSLLGDDFIDFDGSSLEGQFFVYDVPGIYTPTVEVTDVALRVYVVPALVHVATQQSLDAAMQAVWNGFKTALRTPDRASAANFLHSDVREDYSGNFMELPDQALLNIDRYFTAIELVKVTSGGAKYEMMRDGYSYAILFAADQDGIWRIRQL
jgi:hypothetical protein